MFFEVILLGGGSVRGYASSLVLRPSRAKKILEMPSTRLMSVRICVILLTMVAIQTSSFSQDSIQIETNCSTKRINLNSALSLIDSSVLNSGVILSFHTGTPASAVNELTDISNLPIGTYYATFKDTLYNCYADEGNAVTAIKVFNGECMRKIITNRHVAFKIRFNN